MKIITIQKGWKLLTFMVNFITRDQTWCQHEKSFLIFLWIIFYLDSVNIEKKWVIIVIFILIMLCKFNCNLMWIMDIEKCKQTICLYHESRCICRNNNLETSLWRSSNFCVYLWIGVKCRNYFSKLFWVFLFYSWKFDLAPIFSIENSKNVLAILSIRLFTHYPLNKSMKLLFCDPNMTFSSWYSHSIFYDGVGWKQSKILWSIWQ